MEFSIEGAIDPNNPNIPVMFGFYLVIMRLLVMYPLNKRRDIGYIHIPDTNYVLYLNRIPPTLGYVVDTPNYTSPKHIGSIMLPGCEIPDLSKRIVTQPCPGIYNASSWRQFRTKLLSVTDRDMTCFEFANRVATVLQCIGYMSCSMHYSAVAIESEFSVSEIMSQLKYLFDQKEVDHATNHMTKIFELMTQLECVVHSSAI